MPFIPLPDAKRARAEKLFFAAAVVVVVAVKIVVMAMFWNDRLGDYSRLEAFADIILSSHAWLHDAGIGREALPPEIWKTPGYPLLIAAAKLLLGESWANGIMVLNSVVSLIAGLFVRRLALALRLGSFAATVAFLLFEFSVPASTDVLLMPDGLYGSMATMVICAVGARFVSGEDISIGGMAAGGFAIALCFFIREGFLYLILPLGIALVLPMWWSGAPLRRTAALLLVFCLPTVATAAGIMAWNRYRTGHFMVAMVSETVYLIAALKTAEKDPSVFAGDTPLDRVARSSFSDYDYGDAQKITQRLFREYGLLAPELYRIARRKFAETVVEHPRAYFLSMTDRFRFGQQASMAGDLLMRLDDLEYWRFVIYHFDYYGGWRATAAKLRSTGDLSLLTPELAFRMVPRLLTRAMSIGLFLVFLIGLPVLVLRDLKVAEVSELKRRASFLFALYGLYWAVFGIHLLVSVEIRYLGSICSIPIIGSLAVITRIGGRQRTKQCTA